MTKHSIPTTPPIPIRSNRRTRPARARNRRQCHQRGTAPLNVGLRVRREVYDALTAAAQARGMSITRLASDLLAVALRTDAPASLSTPPGPLN